MDSDGIRQSATHASPDVVAALESMMQQLVTADGHVGPDDVLLGVRLSYEVDLLHPNVGVTRRRVGLTFG